MSVVRVIAHTFKAVLSSVVSVAAVVATATGDFVVAKLLSFSGLPPDGAYGIKS